MFFLLFLNNLIFHFTHKMSETYAPSFSDFPPDSFDNKTIKKTIQDWFNLSRSSVTMATTWLHSCWTAGNLFPLFGFFFFFVCVFLSWETSEGEKLVFYVTGLWRLQVRETSRSSEHVSENIKPVCCSLTATAELKYRDKPLMILDSTRLKYSEAFKWEPVCVFVADVQEPAVPVFVQQEELFHHRSASSDGKQEKASFPHLFFFWKHIWLLNIKMYLNYLSSFRLSGV